MALQTFIVNIKIFLLKLLVFNLCLLFIIDITLKLRRTEIQDLEQNRRDQQQRFDIKVSDESFAVNRAESLLSTNLSSSNRKHFIFIGYRNFWPFYPPFECSCQDHSIFVEALEFDDDFQNTTIADCLIFVLSYRGRITKAGWQKLRENRGPRQKWIFASRESALTTHEHLSPPKKFRANTYHLSFTYHSTADFYVPYGNYVPRIDSVLDFNNTISRIRAKKTNLISWMSSSCGVSIKKWRRVEFAKLLSEAMPLHRYGTCGNMTCDKHSRTCKEKLLTYKFSLILENSCCSEYITEKFWNSFLFEQVPVVFGATMKDYLKISPPYSFIHMENFSNVDDLVEYLYKLDNDDSLYEKYHEWRQFGEISVAKLPRDFVSSCHSLCRIRNKLESLEETNDTSFHFDPYGASWYGSCRNCDRIAQKLLHN